MAVFENWSLKMPFLLLFVNVKNNTFTEIGTVGNVANFVDIIKN